MKTGRRNSNSTEFSGLEARIQRLFERSVLGNDTIRSESLASMKTQVFTDAESYFEPPRHPGQLSHQTMDLDSEADLKNALEALWKDDPARLALIPEMVAIAMELKNSTEEQSAEIDSFIYVMY
jgi:hypothetical protein